MSKTIFVKNLSYSVTTLDLTNIFNGFGVIKNVKLIRDRVTGDSRGFGFVSFTMSEEALSALVMDGQSVQGRILHVALAKEKQTTEGSN